MRIAFIADGRAEHARRWIRHLAAAGDEVLLVSTFPAEPLPGVETHVCPGMFRSGNAFRKGVPSVRPSRGGGGRLLLNAARTPFAFHAWQALRLLEVPFQAASARRVLDRFQPDIVHAMRVQDEGYLAAKLCRRPWVLSIWGADLTWFLRRNSLQRRLAAWALRRADAVTADCDRDLAAARKLGLALSAPARYFPGNGGVDLSLYRLGLPAEERSPLIVYARGVAPYVRIDSVLRAFRQLLGSDTGNVSLVLIVQSGFVEVVSRMALKEGLPRERFEVRPFLSQERWSDLLARAAVFVSPSLADGTPNGMLEAMACGAFPVMSRLNSIAEWIVHGVNGLLFDPRDNAELAECLHEALQNLDLRRSSQQIGRAMVAEKADLSKVIPDVREFYGEVMAHWPPSRTGRGAGTRVGTPSIGEHV